jgi:hypothetical protein
MASQSPSPLLVVALAELGKLLRHFALERQVEADQPVVIAGMQLDQLADAAGHVALVDGKSHDLKKFPGNQAPTACRP